MIRRKFMAMLGLAPAAAIVKPGPATPTSIPFATPPVDFSANVVNAVSDGPGAWTALQYAQRKVHAIRYARKHGLENDWFVDTIEMQSNAMRSWSPVFKTRWRQERAQKAQRDLWFENAVRDVEREIKLAAAPEWVRRFL